MVRAELPLGKKMKRSGLRVLITGAPGAMGSYLAEYIKSLREYHVIWGIGRRRLYGIRDVLDYYQQLDLSLNPLGLASFINAGDFDLIFNLASDANVRNSFLNPVGFTQNNVLSTVALLDAIVRSKSRARLVICSCHDEQTELVTRRGIIKFTDICEDDQVVAFNPATESVEFRPIKRIIVEDYTGRMIRIRGRWIDQLVTPNHSLLYKADPTQRWKFEQAQNIARGSNTLYFPKGQYRGGISESLIRVGSRLLSTKDVFYLLGLYIGDGNSDVRVKKNRNRSGLKRSEYLRAARVGGRFRSFASPEGTEEFSYSISYRVFLSIPKEDKARVSALECIRRLGLSPREYDQSIFFTSKDFVEFFDQVGHSAQVKVIPEWAFSYSAEYLQQLYDGLIDSDGCRVSPHERLTTVSKSLVDSFSLLCLLLGKTSTTIKTRPSSSVIDGRVVNGNGAFYVTGSKASRNIVGRNFADEYYSGKVWCLEIDELHNFAVRRNGRITFSGNSSEVYGNVPQELNPIDEVGSWACDRSYAPVSPYAATKVSQEIFADTYARCYGIPMVITRAFGYINPRRKDLVATALASQIVRCERGEATEIVHGDLTPVRSFADARDIAAAYWMAATRTSWAAGNVYNIGSPEPCSIYQLLEMMNQGRFPHREEKTLKRPSDIFYCVPKIDKFVKDTGWQPKYTLAQSLEWLLQTVRNGHAISGLKEVRQNG